jgi:tripartite-type tricarboxylate transporter receptor subunit TctC
MTGPCVALAAVRAALAAIFLAAGPGGAWALDYPTRPARILVGYAAGGAADLVARLAGQSLSDQLGQSFIVENRPGAGTNIATETVAKAPPDGYTLLLISAANAINASLYTKLGFNFIDDIVPVATLGREPNVMEVNPSVPARTFAEFIAYTRANPGKITMASGGVGAASHLSGAMLMMLTGVSMVHVPYRGAAPALGDLLGGQVQLYFAPISSTIEYIRLNRLRPLAVTTAHRSDVLPDIPAIREFLDGYEASQWYGIGAPRNTPAEILDKLRDQLNAIVGDPKFKTRLADLGETAFVSSPAEFRELIATETEKWAKVVKFAGVKAD